MGDAGSDSLLGGATVERQASDGGSAMKISSTQATMQSTKLGMIGGVFVPTMNSIFGVVVFLRWGFAVGHAGVGHVLLMLLLGGAVSYFTTVSVSGLSTNETVRAGGAYYMISRAIGVEFGGALGVMFFVSQTLGIGFYTLGCTETIMNVVHDAGYDFPKVAMAFIIHTVTFIMSLAGNKFFSRISSAILVVIIAALIVALLSYWFRSPGSSLGYVGMSASNFVQNFGPSYAGVWDFLSVFGVVYPSMTAILTGANMSGSLAEPGHAIPVGTALSVLTMMVSYGLVVFSVASGTTRDVLQNNFFVLQDQCWWPPLVLIGTLSATFSSALSGLVSTAKILHAMSLDRLFPGLHVFQKESKGGEPVRAVVATWLLSALTLLMGDVNAIAPLLTNFVLITFAGLNFACMALHITRSPNFRPTYKGSSWKKGFIGLLLCLIVMFLINTLASIISIVIASLIGLFLYFKPPATSDWGKISQALLMRFVQSYLLKLDNRKTHIRFWRPVVLGLFSEIDTRTQLIEMGQFIRKTGLYTISHVHVSDPREPQAYERCRDIQLRAAEVIVDESELRSFLEVLPSENLSSGALSLMLMSGMGSLKSNTIFLSHPKWPCQSISFSDPRLLSGSIDFASSVVAPAEKELPSSKQARLIDWLTTLQYGRNYGKHVIVATNCDKFNVPILLLAAQQHLQGSRLTPRPRGFVSSLFKGSQFSDKKPLIDVWITSDMNILEGDISENQSLNAFLSLCQIASLFHMNREFRQDCQLRVNILSECSQADVRSTVAEKMLTVLKTCRIDAVVNVIALAEDERVQHAISDAESHHNAQASKSTSALASPPTSAAATEVPPPPSSEDGKWLDDIFGTGSIVQSVSKVNAKVINLIDTFAVAQEMQPLASSVVTSHDDIGGEVEMSSISREKFRDGFNRLDTRSKYHITAEIIKQHSSATIAVFLLAIEQVHPAFPSCAFDLYPCSV
jgi:solute carrier family 12 (potassium/chloride transporters), member 9